MGPFSCFKADGSGEGDGWHGALDGRRVGLVELIVIRPNSYISEMTAKELVLREEHSTTKNEPDFSDESEIID